MITRQHAALLTMAIAQKEGTNNKEAFYGKVHDLMPWALLSDGIRAYIGPRQAGHHEMNPSHTDCSWMQYPSPEVLKSLTKETAPIMIKHHVAEGYMKCVIGEQTNIDMFDQKNYGHKYHTALRIHMLQDCVLDAVLREKLVDCTKRFEDKFVVHHNHSIQMDGQELRKQVALFEELGFIHLCGKVYESTNHEVLLNGEWFEKHVLAPLMEVYPPDLAVNTFKYMKFSEELDRRISAKEFKLTDEEKASVYIAEDLEAVLDEMYSEAYLYTLRSL